MHRNINKATLIGLIEGLLLLRLVALLFAARPDNPWIMALLTLTTPLAAPFALLDRWAGQPRFGARLELATLATMLLVLIVGLIWQRRSTRQAYIFDTEA